MLKDFSKNFFVYVRRFNLDYWLVVMISLALFGWLQASTTLPEPDSFYHAKMGQILASGTALQAFPWLNATPLKASFVDHHFLYHLLLVPFVKLFDPLIGVKIATVIFAAIALWFIYFFLKQFRVKAPFVYVIFLCLSAPWLFRASLVKTPLVFLIICLIGFYLLAHRKNYWLALISFLSVWLYGGWPLLTVIALSYTLIFWLLEKFRNEESLWYRLQHLFKTADKKVSWKGLGAVVLGQLAGIIINPYFPANLHFYWQQIFEIAVVNYQKVIGVGGEWYPYGVLNLITDAPLVCTLLVISVLIFILSFKKQSIYSWTFGFLALAFLVLTLKSRRNVEFFIPFTVIFSALSFSDFYKKFGQHLINLLKKSLPLQSLLYTTGLMCLALIMASIPLINKTKQQIVAGWNIHHYQAAATWLKTNTPAKSIVANASWDDFTFLFYYNTHNYYLTGLDPTFMYQQNPLLFNDYVKATLGEGQNLKYLFKDRLGASYVFMSIGHAALNNQLFITPGFNKVYQDSEAIIYQIE